MTVALRGCGRRVNEPRTPSDILGRMRGTQSILRGTALIATGALTVHELLYSLAPQAATEVGHGYLPLVGIAAALVLAVAFARLAALAARARRTGRGEPGGLGFTGAWLLSSVALASIFGAQELLEGMLSPARTGGVAALLADGAWTAVPLAVGVGAIVALALMGARAVVAAAARRTSGRHTRRPTCPRPALTGAHSPRRPALATHLSGRAPPLAV